MKTALLYLLTPLLTFCFGVTFSNMFSPFLTAPAPVAVAEPVTRIIPVEVPVPADVRVEVAPPLPQPILVFDNPTSIYGTDARFFMLGPKPKGFANFHFIELTLSDHVTSNLISLYESSDGISEEFHARFAFVSNRKLFIVTSKGTESGADSGFEYRFDGEFVRTDFEKVAGTKKVALRGTLTKTKDGRTVSEAVVSFRMDYLGC